MANDDPDGLELHPHMLHDLMQNQAGVNSVWVEETNCRVCFGGLFWQTRKKSGEIPGVFGSPGDGIHPTLYPNPGQRRVRSSRGCVALFCLETPSQDPDLVLVEVCALP